MKKASLLIPVLALAFATPALAQNRPMINPIRSTTPPVSAVPPTTPPAPRSLPASLPTSIGAAGFEAAKAAYERVLRQLLAVVTKAQSGLSDMPVPADASCTVTPELQALSDYLNGRITAVSTATTSAELTAMVTETLTYMKDHKEDVASSVMAYADCVYRATLAAEKAYLLSARAQAIARQKQGADVTKLLADIEAATTIVAESEKQYDAATKQSQKVDAMKTLASSVAYLQQIQVALNGPIVPATMIPSSLPSLPPSSRLSSIPRSEPPRSALPPISATPSSSAPLSESPESLPPSPTPED